MAKSRFYFYLGSFQTHLKTEPHPAFISALKTRDESTEMSPGGSQAALGGQSSCTSLPCKKNKQQQMLQSLCQSVCESWPRSTLCTLIFFISVLLKFFLPLGFYWVQSPNEVAERAVVCDVLFWILEIVSLNSCEHSQCCFSALCEVKSSGFL